MVVSDAIVCQLQRLAQCRVDRFISCLHLGRIDGKLDIGLGCPAVEAGDLLAQGGIALGSDCFEQVKDDRAHPIDVHRPTGKQRIKPCPKIGIGGSKNLNHSIGSSAILVDDYTTFSQEKPKIPK